MYNYLRTLLRISYICSRVGDCRELDVKIRRLDGHKTIRSVGIHVHQLLKVGIIQNYITCLKAILGERRGDKPDRNANDPSTDPVILLAEPYS